MITICHRLLPGSFQALLGHLKSSSLASRLARGSFWSLIGSLTPRVLALASAVFAARILGKAAYGELGIIQSTIGMFGTLAGFGMATTASRYLAHLRTNDTAKASRIIALSSVISWSMGSSLGVALCLLAPWLCTHTLAAPHLTDCMRISALFLLFSAVNGAQTGVLSGLEAFKSIARVNSSAGLINFPLVVTGALFFGLSGIVWGMIIAQGIGCLMNYASIRREAQRYNITVSLRSWRDETAILWHFSLPAVLGGLLIGPVTWGCTAFLVHQPDGYNQMGTLNAANQLFHALVWLPYVLAGVVLPLLSERFNADDKTQSIKLLTTSVKVNAAISFPLIVIGAIFSPYIMLSFGKDFAGEWPTLVASLFTAGLVAVQIPVGQIIAAAGRMWLGLSMNLLWSLVFLGGTWILLEWGSFGLASARLLAYLAQGIWAFLYATNTLRSMGRSKSEQLA